MVASDGATPNYVLVQVSVQTHSPYVFGYLYQVPVAPYILSLPFFLTSRTMLYGGKILVLARKSAKVNFHSTVYESDGVFLAASAVRWVAETVTD